MFIRCVVSERDSRSNQPMGIFTALIGWGAKAGSHPMNSNGSTTPNSGSTSDWNARINYHGRGGQMHCPSQLHG